jgi:transposase-like protein
MTQVAGELGIQPSMLRAWRRAVMQGAVLAAA